MSGQGDGGCGGGSGAAAGKAPASPEHYPQPSARKAGRISHESDQGGRKAAKQRRLSLGAGASSVNLTTGSDGSDSSGSGARRGPEPQVCARGVIVSVYV